MNRGIHAGKREGMFRLMIKTGTMQSTLRAVFYSALVAYFISAAGTGLNAGTSITYTLVAGGFDYDTTDLINKAQAKSDLNGPFIAEGFALANITGYPNGSATIGTFPHFEAGVSFGAGCTNMEYYDDTSEASTNGSLPMIIPNPVFHFGFGLIGGLDFIGKIFSFDSGMYKMNYENDLATPDEYSFYSIGGRVRYNILPRFTLVPALFSFGGVTISVGGDAMFGKMKVHGKYDAVFNNLTIDNGGGTTYTFSDVQFNGTYEADVTWKVISGTVSAFAHLELFTIFDLYTGLGITLGTGFFNYDFTGDGLMTTTDALYTGVYGSAQGNVGTLNFISENKYKAYPAIYTLAFGTEVSLFFLKAYAETMVNMHNGKDVTAMVGARLEF